MKTRVSIVAAGAAALLSTSAMAQNTTTSPTGGPLPSGVTKVGGIVLDLQGTSGTRVVSQLAASSLYVGYADNGTPVASRGNPLLIGTQTGFTASTLAALGGISAASVRITLYDGDNQSGNFDFNDNTLLLDGTSFGNWSTVTTYQTSNDGNTLISTGLGFGDNILSTGFFSSTDPVALAALFASLSDGSLNYQLLDVDPNDNYFDFTQGVDGGLINVGTPPVVTPSVPEPATWAMMLTGFGVVGSAMRRRKVSTRVRFA